MQVPDEDAVRGVKKI